MMKNKAFLNFFGKCLSKKEQYLVVHDIFGGGDSVNFQEYSKRN